MGRGAIKKILARARKSRSYLALLISNPAKAIEGYKLTPEEITAFSANDPAKLLSVIKPAQGEEEVAHDAGCAGSETCVHTCQSTCHVTFLETVGDEDELTEGFTEDDDDDDF